LPLLPLRPSPITPVFPYTTLFRSVRVARPVRGPAHRRPGGGHVPGTDRRGGTNRAAVHAGRSPVHPGAHIGDPAPGPPQGAQPAADPAHRGRPVAGQPTLRMPVPDQVPEVRQPAVGNRTAAVRRGGPRPRRPGRGSPDGLPLRRGPPPAVVTRPAVPR